MPYFLAVSKVGQKRRNRVLTEIR